MFTILFRVAEAAMTWKIRKRAKMILTDLSSGRIFKPSLNSKKRIIGNCRRRVRSQNPASSGTCNREIPPFKNWQLGMEKKKHKTSNF